MPASAKSSEQWKAPPPSRVRRHRHPGAERGGPGGVHPLPLRALPDDPNWVPPLEMERKDFLESRRRTPGSSSARSSCSSPGATARWWAGSPRSTTRTTTSSTEHAAGFFGMFECIDDAGGRARPLRRRRGLGEGPGLPGDDGAVELQHQLRVRGAGGGLRGAAGDHDDLQPPLLRRAATRPAGFTKAKDLWAYELSSSRPAAGEGGADRGEDPRSARASSSAPVGPGGLRRRGRSGSRTSTTRRGRTTGASSP